MSNHTITINDNGLFTIQTPRGKVVQYKTKNGTIKAKLEWDDKFEPKWGNKFIKVQKYIDSTCLRFCEPYTPLVTGTLIKTGILGTTIGTGRLVYLAPYARDVYYKNSKIGRPTGPLRGPMWFERMKADKRDEIVNTARRMMKSVR